MENQHQHIKGYPDLSELEIALMNEIKGIEAQICSPEGFDSIRLRFCQALNKKGLEGFEFAAKLNTFETNWSNAHTFLQTGFMWAVRAIAQPSPTKPTPKLVWHQVDEVTLGEDLLKADDQLLVETEAARLLMTGAMLRDAWSESGDSQYKRFMFLRDLPV